MLAERIEMNPGYAILNELEILGSASAKRGDLESVLSLAAHPNPSFIPVPAEALAAAARAPEQAAWQEPRTSGSSL